ncbi:hypothetical protein PR048_013534, partial [Dryococelus australis]
MRFSSTEEVDKFVFETLLDPRFKMTSFRKTETVENDAKAQLNECKSLKVLAKKYLCVPPASVCSEHIFSTALFICHRKRKRIDPETAKMLVFLNKNMLC